MKGTQEFLTKTPKKLALHIDFSDPKLRKNYIGTLKHHLFEKIMNIAKNPSKPLSDYVIKKMAKDMVKKNCSLIGINPKDLDTNEEFDLLWNRIKRDFFHFARKTYSFKLDFVDNQKKIMFKNREGNLSKLIIHKVRFTEKYVKSETLGVKGKIDVIFESSYFPDVQKNPKKFSTFDLIGDLKTGEYTKKNNHQIMYYMMAYFGDNLTGKIGIVIYSKSLKGEAGLTLDLVFPFAEYFQNLVRHRNALAAKFDFSDELV